MIDFMVLTAPRSASTWVSNWLTVDQAICVHEPLWHSHYEDLDARLEEKYRGSKSLIGISETGLAKFPEYVNSHSARKVILHRDLKECSDSLEELGFRPLKHWEGVLEKIEGRHYHYLDVFDSNKGREIYEFLLQKDFDELRFELMCEIEMQPHFKGIKVTDEMREASSRLLRELRDKN